MHFDKIAAVIGVCYWFCCFFSLSLSHSGWKPLDACKFSVDFAINPYKMRSNLGQPNYAWFECSHTKLTKYLWIFHVFSSACSTSGCITRLHLSMSFLFTCKQKNTVPYISIHTLITESFCCVFCKLTEFFLSDFDAILEMNKCFKANIWLKLLLIDLVISNLI